MIRRGREAGIGVHVVQIPLETVALESLLESLSRRQISQLQILCGGLESVQSGWSGCGTGNGEKLSNSQVSCLAQLCLAAA